MLELVIIKELLNYSKYIKYRHHIKISDDNKELTILYRILDKLMEKYSRDITMEEYSLSVININPDFEVYLKQIRESNIGDDVLADNIQELVNRSLAYELAIQSLAVSEGRKDLNTILDFYTKFENKEAVKPTEFVTDDLEELWHDTIHTPGLRWRLHSLNKMLGSLRQGDFGFVFARPETGKTTFLASEVTYFAEQTDRPILWFNNEEGGKKVKVRIFQGSLGVDLTTLYADRIESHKKFLVNTKGNIKLYDSAEASHRQIERICKEMNPALVIFDQIDKIKGFDNDREDLRLGAIYIWARELAKRYCPVIGICQSDVTGENKRWLTMDNVANAKTSKQAEADWILGIGAVHDQGLEFIRYLHASKNKLSGDEDSDNNLRHGKIEVKIRPDIARYEDL